MKLWEALAEFYKQGHEDDPRYDFTTKIGLLKYLTSVDIVAGFFGVIPWLTNDDVPDVLKSKSTALEYYLNRSAEKQISPLYKLFTDAGKHTDALVYQKDLFTESYLPRWKAYYDYLSAELNVDTEYTETISKTGTDSHVITNDDTITDDGQVGSKVTTDYSDGVAGFNSASYVNDTRSTRTETANSNDNTNHNTRTVNADHTDDLTYGSVVTKEGRNVPQVKLLDDALKFKRDNIFLDMVFKDIDSVLTQPMYM